MVLQSIGLMLNTVMSLSLTLKKQKKYPSELTMKNFVNSPTYINEYSQIENMMKKVLLTLGLLLTTSVVADDRPLPDKVLVSELKQYCAELAEEDGTDGKELPVFILDCVNEELDTEGYQLLTKLV
ncbi:MAG: hypothetical protein ACJAV1_003061 [Paraglaciecola sp.]|jgi:hypothetical protein